MFNLDKTSLNERNQQKHFGTKFDNRLSLNHHINYVTGKLSKAIYLLTNFVQRLDPAIFHGTVTYDRLLCGIKTIFDFTKKYMYHYLGRF